MRKLVIALSVAAAIPLVYVGGSANAADMSYKAPPPAREAEPAPAPRGPSHYYVDWWWWDWWPAPGNGYGPYAECDGGRCYIGPPYTNEGRRREYGQYYYGWKGGYSHDWAYWRP